MPDISIITATFNAEATIRDCLSSVRNQQNILVEHIIIDGGSKDRTVEIVRSNVRCLD
jgi:glycosyltransferase involved in cell wall biosynthesis